MSSRRWTSCSQRVVYVSASHVQGLRLTRALNGGGAGVQIREDTLLAASEHGLGTARSRGERLFGSRVPNAKVAETLHAKGDHRLPAMTLYEIVLRRPEREEIRFTDYPPKVGSILLIDNNNFSSSTSETLSTRSRKSATSVSPTIPPTSACESNWCRRTEAASIKLENLTICTKIAELYVYVHVCLTRVNNY